VTRSHEVRHCLGRTGLDVALECSNVGPRAESTTRPRDNDSSDGVVEFDAVQSVHHSRYQLVAKGVQFLGSVQCKDRDGASVLTQEDRQGLLFSFFHRSSLCRSPSFSELTSNNLESHNISISKAEGVKNIARITQGVATLLQVIEVRNRIDAVVYLRKT
jgi:hypothetical protein